MSPMAGFLCPDGVPVDTEDCLQHCRFSGGRCLTRATLKTIADSEREWTGRPSTTQLLDGTRLAFLKITKPYYIDPKEQMFALLGTRVHEGLSHAVIDGVINEQWLEDSINTGTLDNYDSEENILTDYKVYGSYSVKKLLEGDAFDVEMQLNRYRILLEQHGYTVERMQVEAIVRDGGLAISRTRGITEKVMLIPIRFLPDDEVMNYYKHKADALQKSLRSGEMPEVCSPKERWDGNRCRGYCQVWNFCDLGRSIHGKDN